MQQGRRLPGVYESSSHVCSVESLLGRRGLGEVRELHERVALHVARVAVQVYCQRNDAASDYELEVHCHLRHRRHGGTARAPGGQKPPPSSLRHPPALTGCYDDTAIVDVPRAAVVAKLALPLMFRASPWSPNLSYR